MRSRSAKSGGEPMVRSRAWAAALLAAAMAGGAYAGAADAAAPAGAWDAYNLAPASRTVQPAGVLKTGGTVDRSSGVTTLRDTGSYVTFDFGKEVGGFVKLRFGAGTSAGETVGLTFSESSVYAEPTSNDASNGGSNNEPPLEYRVTPGATIGTRTDQATAGRPASTALTASAAAGDTTLQVASTTGLFAGSAIRVDDEAVQIVSIAPGRLTVTPSLAHPHGSGAPVALGPQSALRGGFRYLTVVNRSAGTLQISGVSVEITFTPQLSDLRAYKNYFYSNDRLVNRVWYGGAYTVQTNIIANDQGRVWGPPALGGNNNALVGELGSTVLVDGAKRDRTVWPGDLGISVPTDYASLGDMVTIKNSLQTLYNHQNAAGALPYPGPGVNKIRRERLRGPPVEPDKVGHL